jgi:AcrR family transcriptional regulator
MATMAKVRSARVDMRTREARAQGRDTREELMEAALAVFAERGYREASVDDVAERAGYSKGAFYWHFPSKDDLFYALLEERVLKPWEESIRLLETAPPDQDMAPEATRLFGQILRGEREFLLIQYEVWAQAVRDPKLRRRYVNRRRKLRAAMGRAVGARLETLGAPPLEPGGEERLATIFIAAALGLAQERLVDANAVSDDLMGETFQLIYAGHVKRSAG